MPRSLDPNAKLTLVLACDVDKPAATQPKIFASAPTLNQQRKLVGLLTSLEQGSIAEKFDAIIDAAAICLTGWENIPVEFSRDTIGDVLNLEEIVEVFHFLVAGSLPSPDDKKKSE
jgi:hypothetical protein